MEISLLFKSTAGTSKPAAAGITEIIRHKRLIYIKMLINLLSLSPVRLRWPGALDVCDLCVWRRQSLSVCFFWSVMNEESGSASSLCLSQSVPHMDAQR